MKAANAPAPEIAAAEKALAAVPKDEEAAKKAWTAQRTGATNRSNQLANMPRHGQQFAGNPDGDEKARTAFDTSRRNFLALVFCLMVVQLLCHIS